MKPLFLFTLFLFTALACAEADPVAVLRTIDYFPSFALDGCNQRATLMGYELRAQGIPSARITIEAKDEKHLLHSPSGPETWGTHTAPLLVRDVATGKWVLPMDDALKPRAGRAVYVLDPLFTKKLVPLADWVRGLRADASFKMSVEPASFDPEDEFSLSRSCGTLMTYSFLGQESAEKIKSLRAKIYSRARQFGGLSDECAPDGARDPDRKGLEKQGLVPGGRFRVLVGHKKNRRCNVGLDSGSSAWIDDGHGGNANDGSISYQEARYDQALRQRECYESEGSLEIQSVEYSFTHKGDDYFVVKAAYRAAGQFAAAPAEFIVDGYGEFQRARLGNLSSIAVHEMRVGEFPPFREQYYYGSNVYGIAGAEPFWMLGLEDKSMAKARQFMLLR